MRNPYLHRNLKVYCRAVESISTQLKPLAFNWLDQSHLKEYKIKYKEPENHLKVQTVGKKYVCSKHLETTIISLELTAEPKTEPKPETRWLYLTTVKKKSYW